jgi:hypothetical protein
MSKASVFISFTFDSFSAYINYYFDRMWHVHLEGYKPVITDVSAGVGGNKSLVK